MVEGIALNNNLKMASPLYFLIAGVNKLKIIALILLKN